LVKLIIDEPETEALRRHLSRGLDLATSRIAVVEVTRAAKLADPTVQTLENVRQLFRDCLLVDVGEVVLSAAARLSSLQVRTLDAIHLASAHLAEPAEVIVYDRRLRVAAAEAGFAVVSPGA
jgi:predicted nucleic acid-binding protein